MAVNSTMLSRCRELRLRFTFIYSAKDRRMRPFTGLSISFFAVSLFLGALGFSAPPSVHANERKSSAPDTAATSANKKEPWKPEDVIYAESAAPQTRISPDAKWLVWVKSTADKDKDARVSNLILSAVDFTH